MSPLYCENILVKQSSDGSCTRAIVVTLEKRTVCLMSSYSADITAPATDTIRAAAISVTSEWSSHRISINITLSRGVPAITGTRDVSYLLNNTS